MGGQRKPTIIKTEYECSISGAVGFVGGQRKPTTTENKHERLISGSLSWHGSGGGQRKSTMSISA